MNNLLNEEYFNNRVIDYIIAAGIIAVGLIIVRIIRNVVLARLHRWAETTSSRADDFLINTAEKFGVPALYYFVIYIGISSLNLSIRAQHVLATATTVMVTYLVIRLISNTVLHLIRRHIRRQERGEEKIKQLGGLMMIINVVIWIMGVIFLIDNLGGDVTALIAGLGIGGIAVALAAQNILGDLFNYFVIFFDRPFEVGDFIIVDDKLGTIEYIGLKTTRIRSLSGEQLVIGNANLTDSRIHNYKRMPRRRVVFTINVELGTPRNHVMELPEFFKSVIQREELASFDRAHFAKYTDWCLQYEMVYYVNSADYNVYMDVQQRINFAIYEEFDRRGISFALPARSLYFKSQIEAKTSVETLN